MPMTDPRVESLLNDTRAEAIGLGFESAFPVLDTAGHEAISDQTHEIARELGRQLYGVLRTAFSAEEASDRRIMEKARAIVPKASVFCPALTAHELPTDEDTKYLTSAALAISLMYAADETMDQGDAAMPLAIFQRYDDAETTIPTELTETVARRTKILEAMEATVQSFTAPEDVDRVTKDYTHLVLLNEARLQVLSNEFLALPEMQKPDFLDRHVVAIGKMAVADAGVQSVVDSLYQGYRRHDPNLPSLDEIYGNGDVQDWMQEANAAARLGDEKGDQPVDAGLHPELGAFSINPFNQHHPLFVETLCRQAHMNQQQITEVTQAFETFHKSTDNAVRDQQAEHVTDVFFKHIHDRSFELRSNLPPKYHKFIDLGMRTLVISVVNMKWGEAKLAGAEQ